MSTAVVVPKIICSECQHENEAERIYCHDCGARLDRSAAPRKREKPDDARKRVQKMFDPQRARIRAAFFKGSKVILGAAVIAFVIELVLPPDMPAPPQTQVLALQVRMDVENALTKHQTPQVELSEDQVNAYLVSALRTKKTALDKPFLDFKRAVVTLQEGSFVITVERSVAGYYSVYTSTAYSVSNVNGKLVASHRGGAIGRLRIDPHLMRFSDIIFSDVWAVLDRDVKLLSHFANIEFHDKRAVLTVPAQS